MPGEQLVDAGDLVIRDAAKNVSKPDLRIDAVELRRFDEGVGNCRCLSTALRRDPIMPGVWGTRWRSYIHFTRCSSGLRSWSPINSITARAI